MPAGSFLSPASLLRGVAACLCLLALLAQASGVVPCLITAAAYFEGSHGIRVHCADGVFELVLTHDTLAMAKLPSAVDRRCTHHHGTAAWMLCLLAESRNGDPDHFLHFANNLTSEPAKRQLLLKPASSDCKGGFSATPTAPLQCPTGWNALPAIPLNTGPPGSWLLQSSLRSVCLLI